MEEATRTSYPELLSRHVLTPLALSETTLAPNAAQCARLLSAGPVRCDPMQVTAPSWGIYSTPENVSRWLQALMHAQPGTAMHRSLQDLAKRSDLKTAKGLDFAGRIEAIGYGWLRMKLGVHDVLQKTGGGGATMNYVIMSPARGRALFVTVSRMDIAMLRRLARSANTLMTNILSDTF
jgi:D-alanyl-D-alanine-carboxypeptidase/D-alanyl-D-alanine-endopeptidase